MKKGIYGFVFLIIMLLPVLSIAEQKLTASDGVANDLFGISVTITGGDRAIVGAFRDSDNGVNSGSAYVFEAIDDVWTKVAKLKPSDAAVNDYFGISVSTSNDRVIVGAHGGGSSSTPGSAYVFQRDNNAWSEINKLTPTGGEASDQFGGSVSFSGDHIIVGTHGDDGNGTDSGSAYIFSATGTVDPQPSVCDSNNLNLCYTPSECSPYGYWYNGMCNPSPNESEYPVPSQATNITLVTPNEIANAPVKITESNSETNLTANFPEYDGPVDIYLVLLAVDGKHWFVNSTGILTDNLEPLRANNQHTTDIYFNNISLQRSDIKTVYWLVAPSNGGEILLSIEDKKYELGMYNLEDPASGTQTPVPTSTNVIILITPSEIANAPIQVSGSGSKTILKVKFPLYDGLIDSYAVLYTSDGKHRFVNSAGELTENYEPIVMGQTTLTKTMDNINISPLDIKTVYWLVAPSNGGDLIRAMNGGAYELGQYEIDNDETYGETPDIILLTPTDTDKITIAWLPVTVAATPFDDMKYEVHISKQEDFEPESLTLYNTITGKAQADVNGLEKGTTYFVRIVAFGNDGQKVTGKSNISTTTFTLPIIRNDTSSAEIAEDLNLNNPTINGSEFVFQKASNSSLPKEGGVLFGYDSEGEMYFRKVDSASNTGTEIIVDTADASLSDVFDQCTISNSIKLFDVAEISASSAIHGTNNNARKPRIRKDGSRYSKIKWDDKLLEAEQIDFAYSEDELEIRPSNQIGRYSIRAGKRIETSSEITLDAGLTFEPKLITEASWGIFTGVESAKVIASGTLSFDAKAAYNFTASAERKFEKDLFATSWKHKYLVGGWPVWQRISLKVRAEFTAKASTEIKASTQANVAVNIKVGASYDKLTGQWTPVLSESLNKSLTAILDVKGGVEAEVRLIPELEVKFYTVAAASIFVEPFLDIILGVESITNIDALSSTMTSITQPSKFDVKLGLDAFVEAKLTILHKVYPLLEKTNVCNIGGMNNICTEHVYNKKVFSIPNILLEQNNSNKYAAEINEGINNKLNVNSIQWSLLNNSGEELPTVGLQTSIEMEPQAIARNEQKILATCIIDEKPDEAAYIIVSAHGILGEVARQYKIRMIEDLLSSCRLTVSELADIKTCRIMTSPRTTYIYLEKWKEGRCISGVDHIKQVGERDMLEETSIIFTPRGNIIQLCIERREIDYSLISRVFCRRYSYIINERNEEFEESRYWNKEIQGEKVDATGKSVVTTYPDMESCLSPTGANIIDAKKYCDCPEWLTHEKAEIDEYCP